MGLTIVHGYLFWLCSWWNAPHASFLHSALHLIREGSLHLLTPEETVYNTICFWYPNLLAHLLAIGMVADDGVVSALKLSAYLPQYLVFLGIALLFRLVQCRPVEVPWVAWGIVACLCTYALFRITIDLSTDSPALLLVTAFTVCLCRFHRDPGTKSVLALLLAFVAVSCFRQFSGIIIGVSLAAFWMTRNGWGVLVGFLRTWNLRTIVAVCCVTLVASFHWPLTILAKTGDPFYPNNTAIFSGFRQQTWHQRYPESFGQPHPRASENPIAIEDRPPETTQTAFIIQPALSLLYNFLSIDQKVWDGRDVLKFLRGFLYSYTIPTLLTLTTILGAVTFLITRRPGVKELPRDRLCAPMFALCMAAALIVLSTVKFFYYKLLYMFYPPVLVLSLVCLRRLRQPRRIVSSVLLVLQTCVFVGGLLYANMGFESTKWGIPRWLILGDTTSLNSFQTRAMFDAAVRMRERLAVDHQVLLHFHPEPGQQAAVYVGLTYYWEDYHYEQMRCESLWQARTKEEVISFLRSRGIGGIVATGLDLAADRMPGRQHALVRMLKNRDEAFVFDEDFAFLR
jgi:hypothetical protein